MKLKKCKICKQEFMPTKPLQSVCTENGFKCAREHAMNNRDKLIAKSKLNAARELKQAKDAIKSRSDWIKEVQQVFNAWIRFRDRDLPCISCQRFHEGQYHAGHYRTTAAAPELRFNELNVHKQCSACNNHKHGNILEYRINLIAKLGGEVVEWLEGSHEPNKYTIEELKSVKAIYKLKLNGG